MTIEFFKSPCLIGPIRPIGQNRIIDVTISKKITLPQVYELSAQLYG